MRANPGLARELSSFEYAADFGIMPVNRLREAKRALGMGRDLQAHHLIEGRFSKVLGVKRSEMPGIALRPEEHGVFTAKWKKAIPYRKGADYGDLSPEYIFCKARWVYEDYPEILNALGL